MTDAPADTADPTDGLPDTPDDWEVGEADTGDAADADTRTPPPPKAGRDLRDILVVDPADQLGAAFLQRLEMDGGLGLENIGP